MSSPDPIPLILVLYFLRFATTQRKKCARSGQGSDDDRPLGRPRSCRRRRHVRGHRERALLQTGIRDMIEHLHFANAGPSVIKYGFLSHQEKNRQYWRAMQFGHYAGTQPSTRSPGDTMHKVIFALRSQCRSLRWQQLFNQLADLSAKAAEAISAREPNPVHGCIRRCWLSCRSLAST